MATTTEERIFIVQTLDGGMQRKSTKFLAQQKEVFFAKNADFTHRLGGVAKALGYEILGAKLATYTTTSSSTSSSSSSTTSSSTTTA